MFKKADFVLFIIIVIFGLAVSWWSIASGRAGDKVIVTVDGQLFGTYSLSQDQEIKVVRDGHQNYITIKGGMVSMTFSDCRNQVCVNEGAISQTNHAIVCLPNKVVVEIKSSKGGDVDVISG